MNDERCADLSFELNSQALAVAQLLAGMEPDFAEYENGRYQVRIFTYPWYNGRERGIVIQMARDFSAPVLNIAFFEHRNSDSICALEWVRDGGFGLNPPTIESDGKLAYPTDDKFDVAKSVGWLQCGEMARWVYSRMEAHYKATAPVTQN